MLQTLVAEVYGPDYERQIEIARGSAPCLKKLTVSSTSTGMSKTPDGNAVSVRPGKSRHERHLHAEADQQTVALAIDGLERRSAASADEKRTLYRSDCQADRSSIADIEALKGRWQRAESRPAGELVRVRNPYDDKIIYHKNLMPVVYVTADVAGRDESPVYPILDLNKKIASMELPEGYALEPTSPQLPPDRRRWQ